MRLMNFLSRRSPRASLRRTLFIVTATVPFSFAACGGDEPVDDDPGGAGGSGDGDGDMGGDGNQVDTTAHTYEADDPLIAYMGRWDTTDPKAPVTTTPASQVIVNFRGDSVVALMDDQFRYSQYRNFFDVVVDDAIVGKVALDKGEDTLELVSGLEPGDHTLRLVRRTESQIGDWIFKGFEIGGVLVEPPVEPDRKIIFIGDSITAGSGIEAANNSPKCSEGAFGEEGGWGIPYHNAHRAYGPVAAESLGAAYHVLGVSGIGLIRNYTSVYDTRPMPEVYDLLFLEKDPFDGQSGQGGMGGMLTIPSEDAWDPDRFVPDAIVVALGTNDFSPGDNPPSDPRPDMEVSAFVDAYIEFVDHLRGYYPEAHVFGMSSPMLGDGWPNADDTFRTDQREAINLVEQHYDSNDFENFHPVMIDKVPGGGCGTHPDAEEHEEMGAVMADAIAEALDW